MTEFLPTIISTLNIIDPPVRKEVYQLLNALKKDAPSDDTFLKETDKAICKLLTDMKEKDLSVIRRSIAILAETAEQGIFYYRYCDLTFWKCGDRSQRQWSQRT